MTIEEIMAQEARRMGRPVFYVDGWEFRSEKETIQFVLFDAAPLVLPDQEWMHERRYSLYVDGEVRQAGNIRTWFTK